MSNVIQFPRKPNPASRALPYRPFTVKEPDATYEAYIIDADGGMASFDGLTINEILSRIERMKS